MVLSVPAVPRTRSHSIQPSDGGTFNCGYIGARATRADAGDCLVVGPGWKGERPPGIKVQAGYEAQPLSAHLKAPPPPAAPAIQFPRFDKELVKTGFLEFLDFALQFAPSGPEEQAIRARLARIAIGAGKTFDFKDLSVEHGAASAKLGIYGNDAAEATYPGPRTEPPSVLPPGEGTWRPPCVVLVP
jgi:hypothetical protein